MANYKGYLKDKDNNQLFTSDDYTTEERVIGNWLGKPLYRKVVSIRITTLQGYHNHNITDLDKVVRAYGFCQASGNSYRMVIPMTYTNWHIDLYDFDKAQFKTNVSENQLNRGFEYVYVIIEYTKTTD